MSKKHHKNCCCESSVYDMCSYRPTGGGLGLVGIAVLILIILQFSKGKKDVDCKEEFQHEDYYDDCDTDYESYDDCEEKDTTVCYKKQCDPIIDNGILFIIALFFLSCGNKKYC